MNEPDYDDRPWEFASIQEAAEWMIQDPEKNSMAPAWWKWVAEQDKKQKARIEELEKWVNKHGRHSMYCRWKDGRYYQDADCTCGLDALKEVKE